MASSKRVVVEVPGRACLIGEELDYVGGTVVTAAIEALPVRLEMATKDTGYTTVHSGPPFELSDSFQIGPGLVIDRSLFDYVRAVFVQYSNLGYKMNNVDIKIESSIPPAAGLSSSAALSVAVAGASNELFGFGLNLHQVCDIAYRAEAEVVGTGCGQMDPYACGLGGLVSIDCSSQPPQVTSYSIPSDMYLVIGNSHESRLPSNYESVMNINAEKVLQRDPKLLHYHAVGADLSLELLRNIADPNAIGRIMARAHEMLTGLDTMSTNAVDSLVEAATQAGAFGAKLTGSGRGGSMVAVVKTSRLSSVVAALSREGAACTVSRIKPYGLEVISMN